MPWDDEDETQEGSEQKKVSSHTVWRAMIIFSLVLDAAVLAVAAVSAINNHNAAVNNRIAIKATHDLSCRVGTFFVGQPILQQPGQSHHDFVETVQKAETFLTALKEEDCSDVKGVHITRRQIQHQLHELHVIAPKGGGSSQASSGSSPPTSSSGSGPTPAPPTPSTPPGRSPPPGTTTTSPSPPPPTTTTPQPAPPPSKPGPVGRVKDRICGLVPGGCPKVPLGAIVRSLALP